MDIVWRYKKGKIIFLENNVTTFKKVSAFKYEKEILSLITWIFNKELDLKGILQKYKRIIHSVYAFIILVLSNHSLFIDF